MKPVPRTARIRPLSRSGALCLLLALGPTTALPQPAGDADQLRLLADSVALLRSLDRHAGYLPEVAAGLDRLHGQLDRLLHGAWEYRLVQRNRFEDSVEQLNALGKEGWELVSVSPDEGFLLKRRLRR
jgi:hypothetical protein